jgi:hypothetical protein
MTQFRVGSGEGRATGQHAGFHQRNPPAKDAWLTLAGVLCRQHLSQMHWS